MKCIHQLIMILGIVTALSQVCLGCRNTRDEFSYRCIELIEVEAYQEALENCSQAILLGSKTATDYVRRGYVRTQLGEYDKAIEDYQKAAKLFLKEGNKRNYQGVQEDLKKLHD